MLGILIVLESELLHHCPVTRLGLILVTLLATSCSPASNPQLETEVAQLRIEVDELKANNAKLEKDSNRDSAQSSDDALRDVANEWFSKLLEERVPKICETCRRDAPKTARRPKRPWRPKPNPDSVYSLDISNAPFEGAANARVTLIKNFEFA